MASIIPSTAVKICYFNKKSILFLGLLMALVKKLLPAEIFKNFDSVNFDFFILTVSKLFI